MRLSSTMIRLPASCSTGTSPSTRLSAPWVLDSCRPNSQPDYARMGSSRAHAGVGEVFIESDSYIIDESRRAHSSCQARQRGWVVGRSRRADPRQRCRPRIPERRRYLLWPAPGNRSELDPPNTFRQHTGNLSSCAPTPGPARPSLERRLPAPQARVPA